MRVKIMMLRAGSFLDFLKQFTVVVSLEHGVGPRRVSQSQIHYDRESSNI